MRSWRFSINILGLIASGVMSAAMFFPWWSYRLSYTELTYLYPYLVDGPGSEFIGYKRSPLMTILTVILVLCILLCIIASFKKSKSGRIILAASAVLVLLGSWRLLVRIGGVAARFHLPIQGHGFGNYGGFARVEVWTQLLPGTYLMIGGAILALLASLLFKKVIYEIKGGLL